MNEPTTKEEALRLLDQLQSKFNISKRDINESFNKSIENNRIPNTKIRLISVDEAIFKVIIPWNKSKFWGNKKENYPSNAFHNNKWFIYFNGWWGPGYKMNNINILYYTNNNSTEYGSFVSEYGYLAVQNQVCAISYQDNHKSNQEIRLYDAKWGDSKEDALYYMEGGNQHENYPVRKDGTVWSTDYNSKYGDSAYRGFFPVITFSL